jgi:hypothetical protein
MTRRRTMMRTMKRSLLVALVLSGVLGRASHLDAQGGFVPVGTATATRAVPAGMFPDIAAFQGFASDVTTDPENLCFGAAPQGAFTWGDKIATNAFWQDAADADGTNEYDVTFAVRAPSGRIVRLLTWRATYPGLTPGSTYDFCAAESTQTPASGPAGLGVPWGKRVVEVGVADSVQGQLGIVTLNP